MKRWMIGLAVMLYVVASLCKGQAERDEVVPKPTLWILPQTHWEGAVFQSREDYLKLGLPHILTALRLLQEYPDYRFTLDQTAYFQPFLERYPQEAATFRKLVDEGRLQIVGGTDVMPDDNMPSGESFIRQLLYAKSYTREVLHTNVDTSWMLDTFGHHAQMPQILRLAGFNSFWYFRGVKDADTAPVATIWQGLDGTRIRSIKPPYVFSDPPRDLAGFTAYMKKKYDSLAIFSGNAANRVILEGGDVSDPELYVPELVEQYNRQANMPFRLRYGVPSEFEKTIPKDAILPIFEGERNPIYQGIYSSRIELKQRMREAERLLTTAEKFAALANLLGSETDNQMTWRAWEPVLFNVTHDLASGVMTNYVYDDTVRSYDFSARLGSEMVETRLGKVEARVETTGEGIPLVVYNTMGWTRTDAAQAEVGFAKGGIKSFDLVDASGKSLPTQMITKKLYEDGFLRQVKFAFIAHDVPALGYSVYHVIPRQTEGPSQTGAVLSRGSELENEFYRATFDLTSGALTSLRVKQGGWEALAGAANVVAEETDQGDFWELNHNLYGSQSSMMTQPVNAPKRAGNAHFSDDFRGQPGGIVEGPVFSEFHIEHPLGSNTFESTIRMYAGLRRIDVSTRLLNKDQHVRYRVLFPTTIADGRNFQEIPFGAIDRPQNAEFPAQNWIDLSNSQRGIALLNRGLPGNNVADNTLMLSLLRSVQIQAYDHVGGFENQASESGLELGKEFDFNYALLPHQGDWRKAGVYRAGLEFNNPLITRTAAAHGGTLPPVWGPIEVSPANVVLSAFKPSKGGDTIIRVYEANGQATAATIQLHATVLAANEANLMEDTGDKVPLTKDSMQFYLHPFEIKTFRLRLKTQ
jgi:alpha-mannosidase